MSGNDADRVTTLCPRCDEPIVWARRDLGGGMDELAVVVWACFCSLSDDEWGDLGAAAAEALTAREEG